MACEEEVDEEDSLDVKEEIHGEEHYVSEAASDTVQQEGPSARYFVCKNEKGREVYRCSACTEVFYDYDLLKRHLITHKKEKKFTCILCSHQFSTKGTLNRHRVTHSEDHDFKCLKCDLRFPLKINLIRHLSISGDCREGNFNCSFCAQTSHGKNELMDHIARDHEEDLPVKVKKEVKLHYCVYCSYSTKRKDHLKKHVNGHSKETELICLQCGVKSPSRIDSVEHMLTHGIDTYLHCSYCLYKTTGNRNLNRHIAYAHGGETFFPCVRCSYRALTSTALKRHILASHQDSMFPCSQCSEKFTTEVELRSHMALHSRNKYSNFSKNIKCYGSIKKQQ
ncbi:gastrula zinc finger protein XlCGF57.1 isoform X2 [Anabrus simplex]